jgi:hypothetical protein
MGPTLLSMACATFSVQESASGPFRILTLLTLPFKLEISVMKPRRWPLAWSLDHEPLCQGGVGHEKNQQ